MPSAGLRLRGPTEASEPVTAPEPRSPGPRVLIFVKSISNEQQAIEHHKQTQEPQAPAPTDHLCVRDSLERRGGELPPTRSISWRRSRSGRGVEIDSPAHDRPSHSRSGASCSAAVDAIPVPALVRGARRDLHLRRRDSRAEHDRSSASADRLPSRLQRAGNDGIPGFAGERERRGSSGPGATYGG